MLEQVLIGLIAAVFVVLPKYLFCVFQFPGQISRQAPIFILLVGVIAIFLHKSILRRRSLSPHYSGLADLLVQIHIPADPSTFVRWVVHGFCSFLLIFFGGCTGPEGAGVEWTYSLVLQFRNSSVRWFEQRRRTDVAMSLAGGISAAFGAPFTATLLPIELGIGGKSQAFATSAIAAFLGSRLFSAFLPIEIKGIFDLPFDFSPEIKEIFFRLQSSTPQAWLAVVCIGLVSGIVGVLAIRLIGYIQKELNVLFQAQTWLKVLAASMLIFLVFFIYQPSYLPPWVLLKQVIAGQHPATSSALSSVSSSSLSSVSSSAAYLGLHTDQSFSQYSGSEVALLFVIRLLSLALVVAGFGSVGIFWPIFVLGGFLGYLVNIWIVPGLSDFTALASLMGGAAFLSAVFRTPLAGAVLAFELSQSVEILFPTFLATVIAGAVCQLLRTPSLINKDLEVLGVSLAEGRSVTVLNAISVRDAMIIDHCVVKESELVSTLYTKINDSKYPFLPVVDSQGAFVGLLTLEMIQAGWQSQTQGDKPLANLLEAKDLLYRSRLRVPTIRVDDRLSITTGMFDELPCLPVLSDGKKVVGLLFVHNVRLAYDREVIKRYPIA